MFRRSLSISQVQHIRKACLSLVALPVAMTFPFMAAYWPDQSIGSEAIEACGLGLIALAVMGRTRCALYIGGRKKREVVDTEPYSLSRNPLYLFSVLGALGIGLSSSSLFMGAVLAGLVFIVFDAVVRREESFSTERFGSTYIDYRYRVSRWLSVRNSWRDAESLDVRPRLVLTTFRDASVMLLAVPLIEAIEELQLLGHLPVLVRLPLLR